MSAGWRITRGEQQIAARDVAELKLMAVGGKIQPGDLVQEPGGTSWSYAIEVPELDGLIKSVEVDEKDIPRAGGSGGRLLRVILLLWGLAVLGAGFGGLAWMWKTPPELLIADRAVALEATKLSSHAGAESAEGVAVEQFEMLEILDAQDDFFEVEKADGTSGWVSNGAVKPVVMAPTQGMATQYSNLLGQPDSSAAKVGEVKANEVVELLQKKGGFYQVKAAAGTGWVGTSQVLPGYMFSQALLERYDPKFNPRAYVNIANRSWTHSQEPDQPETMTNMIMKLENFTHYGMSSIVLRITFLDGQDKLVGTVDYKVPGLLPPAESEGEPGERFLEGIEIDIVTDGESHAKIETYSAVALSPADYSRLKAGEEARLAAEAEAAAK